MRYTLKDVLDLFQSKFLVKNKILIPNKISDLLVHSTSITYNDSSIVVSFETPKETNTLTIKFISPLTVESTIIFDHFIEYTVIGIYNIITHNDIVMLEEIEIKKPIISNSEEHSYIMKDKFSISNVSKNDTELNYSLKTFLSLSNLSLDYWYLYIYNTIKPLINKIVHSGDLCTNTSLSSGLHFYHEIWTEQSPNYLSQSDIKLSSELISCQYDQHSIILSFYTTLTLDLETVYCVSSYKLSNCNVNESQHSNLFNKQYFIFKISSCAYKQLKDDQSIGMFLPDLKLESQKELKVYGEILKTDKSISLNGMIDNLSFSIRNQKSIRYLLRELKTIDSKGRIISDKINIESFTENESCLRSDINITDSITFSKLSKDYNPVHVSYISSWLSSLDKPICHGSHTSLKSISTVSSQLSKEFKHIKVLLTSKVAESDLLTIYSIPSNEDNKILVKILNQKGQLVLMAECT